MLDMKYSRDAERDADLRHRHAAAERHSAGSLATGVRAPATGGKEHGAEMAAYLSSHPASEERIAYVRAACAISFR
jgi:Zn-dependent protease with chaperone function